MSSLLAENINNAGSPQPGCGCPTCRARLDRIDAALQPIRDVFALGIFCPKCDGRGTEEDGSDCRGCAAIEIAYDLLERDER